MTDIRSRAIEGLKAGDSFTVKRTFSEQEMNVFAEITRDYNPVHFSERFAAAKRFSGRICHGLLVAGLLTEIGGQLGWLASRMDFRFKKPVYFGDTIECRLTITEIDKNGRSRATAIYKNQHGVIVLKADLEGIIPGIVEREIIASMVQRGDPTNKTRSNF